jgi:hypothetical protein
MIFDPIDKGGLETWMHTEDPHRTIASDEPPAMEARLSTTPAEENKDKAPQACQMYALLEAASLATNNSFTGSRGANPAANSDPLAHWFQPSNRREWPSNCIYGHTMSNKSSVRVAEVGPGPSATGSSHEIITPLAADVPAKQVFVPNSPAALRFGVKPYGIKAYSFSGDTPPPPAIVPHADYQLKAAATPQGAHTVPASSTSVSAMATQQFGSLPPRYCKSCPVSSEPEPIILSIHPDDAGNIADDDNEQAGGGEAQSRASR